MCFCNTEALPRIHCLHVIFNFLFVSCYLLLFVFIIYHLLYIIFYLLLLYYYLLFIIVFIIYHLLFNFNYRRHVLNTVMQHLRTHTMHLSSKNKLNSRIALLPTTLAYTLHAHKHSSLHALLCYKRGYRLVCSVRCGQEAQISSSPSTQQAASCVHKKQVRYSSKHKIQQRNISSYSLFIIYFFLFFFVIYTLLFIVLYIYMVALMNLYTFILLYHVLPLDFLFKTYIILVI